jgi:hypothetical protein
LTRRGKLEKAEELREQSSETAPPKYVGFFHSNSGSVAQEVSWRHEIEHLPKVSSAKGVHNAQRGSEYEGSEEHHFSVLFDQAQ